jgi:phosphotransferase system HPr (HPr) family protein
MTAATGTRPKASRRRLNDPSTARGRPGVTVVRVAIATSSLRLRFYGPEPAFGSVKPYATLTECALGCRLRHEREAITVITERQLTIMNKVGLHARPAALFVQTAARFKDTRVEVVKDGKVRDAKSILNVLTLGVSQGTTITVRADGPQADAAVAALTDLVDRDFGE